MLTSTNGADTRVPRGPGTNQAVIDLSRFSDAPPDRPLDLLFIHHSCGGQWLADPGPDNGADCIYETHPNGGGLRTALENQGYLVHEASYNSVIGQDTDIVHWPSKFRARMERILTCQHQDTQLPAGRRNRIVMFKSCYPNNQFVGPGVLPGVASSQERTVANAKAAYSSLLSQFALYPDTLFVCVTAPPLAHRVKPEPAWKSVTRRLLGKSSPNPVYSGQLAREFNTWLKDRDGWLRDYKLTNVVVFDYYDILTGEGKSNWLKYPTGDGSDSHPSTVGNQLATTRLTPFLNRAVRRAGLVGSGR